MEGRAKCLSFRTVYFVYLDLDLDLDLFERELP